MNRLKASMLDAARSAGGTPPRGYQRLEQCFTYEPSLGALLLWYNANGTTKVEIRKFSKRAKPHLRGKCKQKTA